MSKITFSSLQRFNAVMAFVHAAQGFAVLLLSRDFSLPVNGTYLRLDNASQSLVPATEKLCDMPLAWLVAGFFFLSSIAHIVIAYLKNKSYNEGLKNGINKFRWFEYATSASVMMVAIAMLVGIYDGMALLMMFSLVAVMNLLGYVMEVHNQTTKRTNWLSFIVGCIAGIVPWIVVAFQFWLGAKNDSSPPTFVYWIFVSIFAFFNLFAINMYLQYKGVGKWKDYLYGERAYIILSLVAKSLLAWQVFAGTLRP